MVRGYRLLYGSEALHDPAEGVFALDCVCTPSLTSAGSLTFALPPTHAMLGRIELLQKRDEAVLLDGDEEVFRGRVMRKSVAFDLAETYECEGNLAYLNDVQLRPYDLADDGMPKTPSAYFNWLVASYNERVDARYRVHVGVNEADRIQGTIYRSNSRLVSVREELREKMLDSLGGYVRMRYDGGLWYVDYLADGGRESAQRVEFGANLTDYMRESSAYERYTAVVPVGRPEGVEEAVYITSLPDGEAYDGIRKEGDRLVDEAAAEEFGIVEGVVECEAALPINVQAAGVDFLRSSAMGDTLEIKAVDWHLVDAGIERIREGDYLRVVSEPHGIDAYFPCLERTLHVSDPGQDDYTLGTPSSALTSAQTARIASLNAGINKSYEAAKGASQAAKDAARDAADAMDEAGGKARIFTEQPVPPYSVGDLWSQGAGGDILKCEHGRSGGEEFHANDWMLASKYTDDALADLAKEAAEAAKEAADKAFDDAKAAADKALEAKAAADEATAKTEVVESQVTEVRQSAKTAQDAADAAQATADDAKDKAHAAESAAGIAQGAAEAAQGSALEAATEAGKAVSVANEAKKQVGDVAADAAKVREDLEAEITSVATTMQADYSKKTDLAATESKLLTRIEQSAAAIKLEAGQTYAKKTDLTDVETALNAKIEVNASGIEQAVTEATTAKADASDAQAKAAAAQEAAGAAGSEAAQAAAAASGAQGAADKAKADALAAQQRADAAKAAADKAKEDYDGLSIRADATDEQIAAAKAAVDEAGRAASAAQTSAGAAKGAADSAQKTADKAKADSATAQAAADASKKKADAAQAAADALGQRMTSAETRITQTSEQVKLAATKTEVAETLKGYYTSAQTDAAIKVRADAITSTVSSVKTTADAAKTAAATAQATANTANNRATYKYGTCATAAATAAKAVALAGFALYAGAAIAVRFDAGNTAASPTLNVNGTGAKAVVINGTAAPSAALAALSAYATATYVYDGTYWRMSGTDQATVDVAAAKSEIKQQADRITSAVSETTRLGTRVSTVEQTANGLSVSLGSTDKAVATAQSTANAAKTTADAASTKAATAASDATTAKSNAASAVATANTAKSTADTASTKATTAESDASAAKSTATTANTTANAANSTANTAKTNAATAQTTANTARTEAANAAKTATNYMEYTSAGLDVGNKSSGKWAGIRTRMGSAAFQVLDAAGTVLASYGANLVEIGKNAKTAVIKLCGGIGQITGSAGATRDMLKISAPGGDLWVNGYNVTIQGDHVNIDGIDLSIKGTVLSGDGSWLYGPGAAFSTICTNRSNVYPVYGARILYDNGSGAVCPISLNETTANFHYVEVYYAKLDGANGGYKCAKVWLPNGKRFILDLSYPITSSNTLQNITARMRFSGAQIVNEYNAMRANLWSGGLATEESAIKIYRVVGYK